MRSTCRQDRLHLSEQTLKGLFGFRGGIYEDAYATAFRCCVGCSGGFGCSRECRSSSSPSSSPSPSLEPDLKLSTRRSGSACRTSFVAYFKDSVSYTHVDYDKRGNWVYTMSIYSENQLPSYIRFHVQFAYPTATINSVQEIHYQNKIAYILHTENKKAYKTLRYTDEDGVEEIEELLKQ